MEWHTAALPRSGAAEVAEVEVAEVEVAEVVALRPAGAAGEAVSVAVAVQVRATEVALERSALTLPQAGSGRTSGIPFRETTTVEPSNEPTTGGYLPRYP